MFVHTITQGEDFYCVYTHAVLVEHGEAIIYAGVCRLREVFTAPDARQNSEWQKYVKLDTPVNMSIVHVALSVHDCMNFHRKYTLEHRPHCNIYGHRGGYNATIRCIETGQTWRNAQECAAALGITKSSLSNHLNRKPYHKTCKGLTFKRI